MKKQQKSQIPVGALKMTPDQVSRMQSLRSSGAAGQHDHRPHRVRTRKAARSAAVRESFDS